MKNVPKTSNGGLRVTWRGGSHMKGIKQLWFHMGYFSISSHVAEHLASNTLILYHHLLLQLANGGTPRTSSSPHGQRCCEGHRYSPFAEFQRLKRKVQSQRFDPWVLWKLYYIGKCLKAAEIHYI